MNDDPIARIRARRATLTAQADKAELEYARLEEQIKQQQQALALLGRNLDAAQGAMQELDSLLEELCADSPAS